MSLLLFVLLIKALCSSYPGVNKNMKRRSKGSRKNIVRRITRQKQKRGMGKRGRQQRGRHEKERKGHSFLFAPHLYFLLCREGQRGEE
jgi:hypothetical protein